MSTVETEPPGSHSAPAGQVAWALHLGWLWAVQSSTRCIKITHRCFLVGKFVFQLGCSGLAIRCHLHWTLCMTLTPEGDIFSILTAIDNNNNSNKDEQPEPLVSAFGTTDPAASQLLTVWAPCREGPEHRPSGLLLAASTDTLFDTSVKIQWF